VGAHRGGAEITVGEGKEGRGQDSKGTGEGICRSDHQGSGEDRSRSYGLDR